MPQPVIPRVISTLFHPLLIPVYLLFILLNSTNLFHFLIPWHLQLILIGITLLTSLFFPLMVAIFLYRMRVISTLIMDHREERIYPILSVAIFYYITYYLLKGVHVSVLFSYYMLGATLLSIAALVINFYSKVSLHMIGMGSGVGLFLGLTLNTGINFTLPLVVAIFLSGVVGFARLSSNAHKPAEIYTGFLMGVGVITFLMILL